MRGMNQNGLRAIPTLRASALRALFQTLPGGEFVEPEGLNQAHVLRHKKKGPFGPVFYGGGGRDCLQEITCNREFYREIFRLENPVSHPNQDRDDFESK